jgi:hypothetical protein
MSEDEMRYRVSAVVTSNLQIVVQARSSDEAEATAEAIDFEKWSVSSNEYEIVDVAKDFFLRRVKVDQDTEPAPDIDGPTLKIVN